MTGFQIQLPMLRADRKYLDRLAETFSLTNSQGSLARVAEVAIDFAIEHGLPRDGPVTWEQKPLNTRLRRDYTAKPVSLKAVEVANLLHYALERHRDLARLQPRRFVPEMVRDYAATAMPDAEVREIHRRAFGEGKDPRLLFDEELVRDLNQVRDELVKGQAPTTTVYFPWTNETEKLYAEVKSEAKAQGKNLDTLISRARQDRRTRRDAPPPGPWLPPAPRPEGAV